MMELKIIGHKIKKKYLKNTYKILIKNTYKILGHKIIGYFVKS